MNKNGLQEMCKGGLQDIYEMSQTDVGKALFLKQQTIAKIEAKAIKNFKKALLARNIKVKDYLGF